MTRARRPAGKRAARRPSHPVAGMVRVLILEDVESDVVLIERELRKAGLAIEPRHVVGREEFALAVSEFAPQLIISDHGLPQFSGREALRLVMNTARDIPVILVTGSLDEETAVEYMKAGAADYVLKGHLGRLGPAALSALDRARARDARDRAESELRGSEARLKSILDAALDAIVAMDATGAITAWNPTAEQMFGWSAAEAEGRPLRDIIIPERYRAAHQTGLERFLSTGEGPILGRRIEIEALHKNGREFPVELTVTPVRVGESWLFSAFVRDISERKQAEDALRRGEDRYRAFIGQSTEGIWRFELDQPLPTGLPPEAQVEHIFRCGHVAECNDAMARMYGRESARDLMGGRLRDLLSPDRPQNVQLVTAFVRAGYRLTDVESLERDQAGREKVFLNNLVGIVEAGHLVRAWGTQRDITERRQLAQQLQQAQKMEAIGRLAGGIAHDFNNIITAIIGYADLVLEDLAPEDPRRSDVGEIHKGAERAAGLTRQLLAFSRRQVLQPRTLDLNAIVAGMENMLRRLMGEDIRLRTVPARDLAPVQADPGQIEQVILNLVVNARDAMPEGGTLTIETANTELDPEYAGRHQGSTAGQHVMIAVTDTGIGMTPEVQARLFEPFFTTKGPGKGTGLGLSTVYGIVKQSGGSIYIYSEPGQGTACKVYLPRAVGAAGVQPAAPAGPPQPLPRGTETVLLAEDAEPVRELARRILANYGYTVLSTRSGEEALQVCREHRGPVELLLTDVVMPEMSGRELAERLAQVRRGVRVIYMSGYTDDAVVRHGIIEAGVHYLQKPFTPEALLRKVRAVLDAGR